MHYFYHTVGYCRDCSEWQSQYNTYNKYFISSYCRTVKFFVISLVSVSSVHRSCYAVRARELHGGEFRQVAAPAGGRSFVVVATNYSPYNCHWQPYSCDVARQITPPCDRLGFLSRCAGPAVLSWFPVAVVSSWCFFYLKSAPNVCHVGNLPSFILNSSIQPNLPLANCPNQWAWLAGRV
jgi:hypothetical protein